jgi:hypothetical protein
MKTSRVQEAIEILKASVEDSSVKTRRVPKPAPRKSKKVLVKAKKVQKS